MKKILTALTTLIALTACAAPDVDANSQPNNSTLQIVATVGQIGDVANNIGGDLVTVTTLLGFGSDPHTYSPVERDLEAFQNADLILYNGLNLEAQLASVIEDIAQDDPTITAVIVGEQVPSDLIVQEIDGTATDPHIWGDVGRWIFVAEAIRDALIEDDPDNAEVYRANAEAYIAELDALDAWIIEAYKTIPSEQRRLVTAHDAFQYVNLAYGVDVFAPQGISTEAEAGVADIQATVDYVVDNEVPAIFFESSIPVDTVEAVVEGASARGWEVEIGGELFADTMGAIGTPEGTYIGMQEHNTATIVIALGGELPPRDLVITLEE